MKPYSKRVLVINRYSKKSLEARGGIEPPIKVLQTFALPLGDRATESGEIISRALALAIHCLRANLIESLSVLPQPANPRPSGL
jgi:hypothetical protein